MVEQDAQAALPLLQLLDIMTGNSSESSLADMLMDLPPPGVERTGLGSRQFCISSSLGQVSHRQFVKPPPFHTQSVL